MQKTLKVDLLARDVALETVRWTAEFKFPAFEQDYEFVALRHENEYPFNEGRVVSNKGLDITAHEFDAHFVEEHVAHSNTLHCVLKERGAYFTGPMAQALGRLPRRFIVCGIEGQHFTMGAPLSAEVARAILTVLAQALTLAQSLRP